MMIPKSKPWRSPKWLKVVHEIEYCVRCRSWEPIQAAHRDEGKGMSQKTDDCAVAALCERCHYELGNGKHLSKEERRAEMNRWIVETLIELARRGRVGVLA